MADTRKRGYRDRKTGNPWGRRPGEGNIGKVEQARRQALLSAQDRLSSEMTIDDIRKLTPLQLLEHAMYFAAEEAVHSETPKEALQAWMLVAALAEKAAPYRHAKLNNVTLNATIRRSATDFSDAELAAIACETGGDSGTEETGTITH